jgi:hypothetical protein
MFRDQILRVIEQHSVGFAVLLRNFSAERIGRVLVDLCNFEGGAIDD